MYPVLDVAQMGIARRFASDEARNFRPGEAIFDVGARNIPIWLVLEMAECYGLLRQIDEADHAHGTRNEGGHQHGSDRHVHAMPGHTVAEQPPDENQHQDSDDAGDRRADQEPAASRTGDRHE